MKSISKLVALGAVAAASASFAYADTLLVDNASNAQPITMYSGPAGYGTQIAQTSNTSLSSGTFTASYTETIYRTSSGTLTFVISVSNNPTPSTQSFPNDSIERITTGTPGDGFSSFNTYASYVSDGSESPLSVSENNGAVGFNFNTQNGNHSIAPGTTADTLVLVTDATDYAMGNFSLQDSLSANTKAFVPAASTPEPNSLVLLGTGLIGAAGMLFLRRRNAEGLL